MSENVEKLEVDESFEKLYHDRHFILSSLTSKQLLIKLEQVHKRNIVCVDFLRNKIRKCEDILKYNDNDTVVIEELSNYEHMLYVVRFCDALIEDEFLNGDDCD